MNCYPTVLFLLWTASALASEPLPEAGHSTIGFASVTEALQALRSNPSVEERENAGWVIFNDPGHRTTWSFTPPDHPAYPAAVKRAVVQRDGTISLETNVQCESSKAACDQLVRDFQALNEKVHAQFNR